MHRTTPIQMLQRTDDYQPGVCNIGPAEIARRRRVGHLGLIAAIGLFVLLVALGAPAIARLLVALPAGLAAAGYLQARMRFCAAFATAGIHGEIGATHKVEDAESLRTDRATARRIVATSGLIGLAVGVIAVLLPV